MGDTQHLICKTISRIIKMFYKSNANYILIKIATNYLIFKIINPIQRATPYSVFFLA